MKTQDWAQNWVYTRVNRREATCWTILSNFTPVRRSLAGVTGVTDLVTERSFQTGASLLVSMFGSPGNNDQQDEDEDENNHPALTHWCWHLYNYQLLQNKALSDIPRVQYPVSFYPLSLVFSRVGSNSYLVVIYPVVPISRCCIRIL